MGVPPSPLPSKSLDWRGVCKNALQNLEPLGIRGQNIDNKELTGVFASAACTAHALTMICFLLVEGKVGCHRVDVENDKSGSREATTEYSPGRKPWVSPKPNPRAHAGAHPIELLS